MSPAGLRSYGGPFPWLYKLTDTILVVCPRCRGKATATRDGDQFRIVCPLCTLVRTRPVGTRFRRQLWLQAPCCGHTLWAFNAGHLDLVEGFVTARLRPSYPPDTVLGVLPTWLILAKHRDEVLRAIRRLRAKL